MQPINVVWFKRDLRLADHTPLAAACATQRPTLLMYCFEPQWQEDPHWHIQHARFIVESLADLNQQLVAQGHRLWVFQADVVELLTAIHQTWGIAHLYSHQETGLAWSYKRDRNVQRWCTTEGVQWHEFAQHAVQRGALGRHQWQRQARTYLQSEPIASECATLISVDVEAEPRVAQYRVKQLPRAWCTPSPQHQRGGETTAQERLQLFLQHHLTRYRGRMSRPYDSRADSSRLSAYLAYGNLSVRTVMQSLKQSNHPSGLQQQWRKRFFWQSHFMQKFESYIDMEQQPLNPAYGPLLEAFHASQNEAERERAFQAWAAGQTGYPLVDACMRALLQTGYLNFRMRALLVSVGCHHLGLPWTWVARHLAQNFLDFEPGIHYPQIQMQAGYTSFNTVRIYNPLQQSLKYDDQAQMIDVFVPELQVLPVALRHQPWEVAPMEAAWFGFQLGVDYPERCFHHEQTGSQARERLWQWRRHPHVQRHVPALLSNQTEQPD